MPKRWNTSNASVLQWLRKIHIHIYIFGIYITFTFWIFVLAMWAKTTTAHTCIRQTAFVIRYRTTYTRKHDWQRNAMCINIPFLYNSLALLSCVSLYAFKQGAKKYCFYFTSRFNVAAVYSFVSSSTFSVDF